MIEERIRENAERPQLMTLTSQASHNMPAWFALANHNIFTDSRDVFETEELASTTRGEKKRSGYRDIKGRPMRGGALSGGESV